MPGGTTQNGTLTLVEDLFANVFLLFGMRARGWLPPRFDAAMAEAFSPLARVPPPRGSFADG